MSPSYLRRQDSDPIDGERPGGLRYPLQVSRGYGYGEPYGDASSFASGKEQIERAMDLFFRSKWLIIWSFITFLVAAAAYTFTREPSYEAGAYVSVDLGSTVIVDRAAIPGTASTNNLFARSDRTVTGEIALLQISSDLKERVFARYQSSREEAAGDSAFAAPAVPPPYINGYVQFLPERGAETIIQIVGTSPDPIQAALIANLYAEEYVRLTEEASRSYYLQLRRSLEATEDERLRELRLAEGAVREYMRREGTAGLDQDGTRLLENMRVAEDERTRLRIELQVQQQSLAALQRQIDSVNPNLTERITAERSVDRIDQRIQSAQALLGEEQDKLDTILRRNPEMRTGDWDVLRPYRQRISMLQGEVDSLTALYVGEAAKLGTSTGGQDGLTFLADLNQRAIEHEIAINGLESQISVQNSRLAQYQRELEQLPGQSMELAQLERDRAHAESMYQYVVERLQETRIAEGSEQGYAELIRTAFVPSAPVYPMPVRDLVLGGFLGILIGLALAVVRGKLDNRIYQPQQVREHGFREIAVIPNLRPLIQKDHDGQDYLEMQGQRLSSSLVSLVNPVSPASEAYRQVRTFAQYYLPNTDLHSLLVSSPGMSEGKSTTAANLAIVMAQAGRKTLLVDADMRRPQQHLLFGLHRTSGLHELISGGAESDEGSWKTFVDNLFVITAHKSGVYDKNGTNGDGGDPEAPDVRAYLNPSELLGSAAMERFLADIRENFDMVIIDSPPVLAATDATLLSTKCDATIVVARTGQTKEGELDYTMEAFQDVGATVLGVILNGFDVSMAFGHKYRYSHYSKYGGYYKYGYHNA